MDAVVVFGGVFEPTINHLKMGSLSVEIWNDKIYYALRVKKKKPTIAVLQLPPNKRGLI